MKYFFSILISVFLISSCHFSSDKENSNIEIKKISPFYVMTLNEEKISSMTFNQNNKNYFIHFWGTWCGPCIKEMPELLDFAKSQQEKNVQFYLIATNDTKLKVLKFLENYKDLPKNITILLDNDDIASKSLMTNQVPETFYFLNNNQFVQKFVGPQNWKSSYFGQFVK
jgi:thiol-disulfide isomerase/thioredoxin